MARLASGGPDPRNREASPPSDKDVIGSIHGMRLPPAICFAERAGARASTEPSSAARSWVARVAPATDDITWNHWPDVLFPERRHLRTWTYRTNAEARADLSRHACAYGRRLAMVPAEP